LIAGTHVAFSSALYLAGAALFEYETSLPAWALAAVASLLPDIDLPTSKLGRVFFFVSTRLEKNYGHRTITHSLLALVVVAALSSFIYPYYPNYFWAIVGGYWSHLWIDLMNRRGADLLWPSPKRFVFPGNSNYRLLVGSKGEMVLLIFLVLASAALFPLSEMGVRAGLQHLLGNFEMAEETFAKGAGKHWYTVRLEATDNLSLDQVKGEYPVVGIWRRGLIVDIGGRLRAVGESETAHNLYPTHTELVRGEDLKVISHRVDMRGRTLRWLLDRIDKSRTYYISGELRMGTKLDVPVQELQLYRPARFAGQVLRLHYAREQELKRYLGMMAAEGELFVQFWLRTGDPPLELVIEDQGTVDVIPAELRQFL